ncbi:hypothetical protein AMECASPLE_017298 [Ameca splendens]|uniref:Uncharacterized protein n=1 Tax=Ameca splendens TaxID=208324 RepID=A0ABV1A9M7_9TELE
MNFLKSLAEINEHSRKRTFMNNSLNTNLFYTQFDSVGAPSGFSQTFRAKRVGGCLSCSNRHVPALRPHKAVQGQTASSFCISSPQSSWKPQKTEEHQSKVTQTDRTSEEK